MKLSISARDEERCDGVMERPMDDSVHRRLETSEYSTSLVHDGWWRGWRYSSVNCQTKLSQTLWTRQWRAGHLWL